MGKQANILSFDEAKRESGGRRSTASARETSARRRPAGAAASARSASARPVGVRATAASRHASSSRSVPACPPAASRLAGEPARTGSRSSGRTASRASGRAAVTSYADRGARSAFADDAPARVRGAHAKQAIDDADPTPDEAEETPQKRSRLQEFRRKRQKDRADKKFDKQFGGSRASSGDAPSGSRAAVYKGEMGTNHRRAARMQNEASGTARMSKLAGFSPLAALASWKQSPKLIAASGVALCLALSCWFLYTPAQQLYQSVREHDRLEAEYAALEQRNASLQSEVENLQTDAGVQDRAHEQFGWVSDGQQTANVLGLSASEDGGKGFEANIVPGSVKAPDTWYSPVLDALFGVQ